MTCGYKKNYILKAFEHVSLIGRSLALRKVDTKIVNRPISIHSLPYNPRLSHISNIFYKFWKVMTQNPLLKKIIPEAPVVNFRECLIRAKLPKSFILLLKKLGRYLSTYCFKCLNYYYVF